MQKGEIREILGFAAGIFGLVAVVLLITFAFAFLLSKFQDDSHEGASQAEHAGNPTARHQWRRQGHE